MAIDPTDRASTITDKILRKLARQATGMSGAEIASLVRKARGTARREKRAITLGDIEAALLHKKPAKSDEIRSHQATHEAGHAVAQLHFGLGSIKQITISGADGSAYVVGHVGDFEGVISEETLTALMVIHLAGRAAEQEYCRCVSAGAGGAHDSDLARATRLAFDLEMTLGFGAEHPLLYRDVNDRHAFLALNAKVAERVHLRLASASEVARDIVVRHQRAIDYLADRLLIEETLEGEALEAAIREVRSCMADSGGGSAASAK